MKLSVIVPSLEGKVPRSLLDEVKGHPEVEIVSVVGVRPVGKARNEGLRRAKGEYVAWVDSDDEVVGRVEHGERVALGWLGEILRNLDLQPPIDALVFDLHAVGWLGMGDLVYGGKSEGVLAAVYENERIQGHLVRTVTRRSLWRGLAFDEQLMAMEDFLILPKVLSRAKKVVYLPRMLYNYICTPGSAISSVNPLRVAESMRVHIRRYAETPEAYRSLALRSCMHGLYIGLQLFGVDPTYRKLKLEAAMKRQARRFLRGHLFLVRCSLHERLRYLCATIGFWAPQRLARWCHFGRKGL